MRLHVIYNESGKIIGGGVAMPEPYGRGPRSGALKHAGQHAGVFEVPVELAELPLHDVADRLRVDVTGKEHKLIAKRAEVNAIAPSSGPAYETVEGHASAAPVSTMRGGT